MFKNAYNSTCNFVTKHAQKVMIGIGGTAAALASSAQDALAVPVLDLSSIGTSITAELTPALAAAMPIAGTLIAVSVGWKLFRRFVK